MGKARLASPPNHAFNRTAVSVLLAVPSSLRSSAALEASVGRSSPKYEEVILNRVIAMFLVATFLSGCVPRAERSVAESDLIFGTVPGTETVLRVKRQCPVGFPGLSRELPVGDYIPVYADSGGIFYAVPRPKHVKCVNCPPGTPLPQWEGWGIYYPIDARSSSPPFLWRQAVNVEWGRVRGEKLTALPEQCWKPYGTAMAIVRNGEEIPLR